MIAVGTHEQPKKRQRNPLSFFFPKTKQTLFTIHSSASAKKSPSNVDGIFGAPLEYAAQFGPLTQSGLRIPDIVYRCFSEIVERGLTIQGIFRLSGAAAEVDELQREFDKSPSYGKYLDLSKYDIHAITGVLKKYLRSLPQPVIPRPYHDRFLMLVDRPCSRLELLKDVADLVMDMPKAHSDLLQYLITQILAAVQQYSQFNLMNHEALAVVFAPVCTGLEQSLSSVNQNTIKKQLEQRPLQNGDEKQFKRHSIHHVLNMDIIRTNTKWTQLWTIMIEHHDRLLQLWSIADISQQWQSSHVHSPNKRFTHHTVPGIMSTPSPSPSPRPPSSASSSGSTVLPMRILMSQFHVPGSNESPDQKLVSIAPPLPPPVEDPLEDDEIHETTSATSSKSKYGVVVMRRSMASGYLGGGRRTVRRTWLPSRDDLDGYYESQFHVSTPSPGRPASLSSIGKRPLAAMAWD
ncbi:Rho GTPase activation protein [Umbelopsis sp. PMI_123]|nr:Rho GTPase activation protein [Umbelopsis sp. PMI_123]